MVFPLTLLRTAQNHPMLIELKNGETYNGHLEACDCWMNVHLRDVICTSKEGDRFWRIPEAFIRGCSIKYLRIPEEVMDCVRDEIKETRKHQRENAKRKSLIKNMVSSEKNKVQNTSQHKY
ncbi:putative U6 snRNA-associated Sm-like protein LSm4 [Trichinella sp. T9]|nr:putative U6 snRNA-associated Sm-like protein LSm4 [Trichinella sp. T9]